MLRNAACRHLLSPKQALSASHDLSSIFSLASTSKQTIHTSALVHETARRREARLRKRDQRDKRFEKERLAKQNQPHPALGYSPGNEDVWRKSKLCSIVLTRQALDQLPVPKYKLQMEAEQVAAKDESGKEILDTATNEVKKYETGQLVPKLANGRPIPASRELPQFLNFGVGELETPLLFEELGHLREDGKKIELEAQRSSHGVDQLWSAGGGLKPITTAKGVGEGYEKGLQYWMGRLLDLKNSNAAGLAFENKRRIVAEFSSGQISDTGRIEVQAALLTHRIHNLWSHIKMFKRDIHNRRRLLELIHARVKILKYLRRTSRGRYEAILPELGIERGAIENEIIMTREMFRTTI